MRAVNASPVEMRACFAAGPPAHGDCDPMHVLLLLVIITMGMEQWRGVDIQRRWDGEGFRGFATHVIQVCQDASSESAR